MDSPHDSKPDQNASGDEHDGRALQIGNLIYLPFARHLAEEDAEEWAKAA